MVDRLGFIGLGIMGQAMALNLLGEEPLAVYNRTRARTEPLAAKGARVAATAAEAADADVVFVVVTDDQALSAVADGTDGILAGLRPGAVVVDHSTVSPALTRRLAEKASARGGTWLDAPVTGGDVGARDGTLTIMVGGEAGALDRVRPYLARMSRRIVHIGPVGQGQTMKLVSNLVSCLNLMAGAEGLQLGLRAGLPFEKMVEVMPYGTAQSFELAKILDRYDRQDYRPGFSVANRLKDLRLALELARALGFRAPLGERAEELFGTYADGRRELDEASYLKRWDEA